MVLKIADETRDVSGREQLAVSLWWVDAEREHVLGVRMCHLHACARGVMKFKGQLHEGISCK